MDRIGQAGGSPTQTLTNGQQGFVDENLSTGQEGTNVTAEWMNAVQEELMSILATAGTTPSITNFGQVMASLTSIFGNTSSRASDGWFRISGDLLLQWGSGTFPASGGATSTVTVTYPVSFGNCWFVTGVCTGTSALTTALIPSFNLTSIPTNTEAFCQAQTSTGTFSQTVPFLWFALGD